jgi:hypothetical protein
MNVKLPYKTDQVYDKYPISLTRQAHFHLETAASLHLSAMWSKRNLQDLPDLPYVEFWAED